MVADRYGMNSMTFYKVVSVLPESRRVHPPAVSDIQLVLNTYSERGWLLDRFIPPMVADSIQGRHGLLAVLKLVIEVPRSLHIIVGQRQISGLWAHDLATMLREGSVTLSSDAWAVGADEWTTLDAILPSLWEIYGRPQGDPPRAWRLDTPDAHAPLFDRDKRLHR